MHITKVAWAPVQDGKILCARTRGLELFYNIGGKPHPGEHDRAALIREVKEEVAVDLIPESIQFVATLLGTGVDKSAGQPLVFKLFAAKHTGEFVASNEIEELRWIGEDDLHLLPPLGQRAFRILRLCIVEPF